MVSLLLLGAFSERKGVRSIGGREVQEKHFSFGLPLPKKVI